MKREGITFVTGPAGRVAESMEASATKSSMFICASAALRSVL